MRALVGHDADRSAFTSIERELFAKDPDRNDCALRELLGEVNGLPIAAKVAPSRSARTGVHEIQWIDDATDLGIRIDGCRHIRTAFRLCDRSIAGLSRQGSATDGPLRSAFDRRRSASRREFV